MKVLSLFDGMSCGQLALNRAGIEFDTYYASEVDKYAIQVAVENNANMIQVGSVVDLDVSDFGDETIDLLIGGSPCQNFSFAGNGVGMSTKDKIEILTLEHYLQLKSEGYEFEGESYLFWEYVRVLKDIQKTNPNVKFLLENVRMNKKWKDLITSILGVEPININSSLVSAQSRNRLFWTNIEGVDQPQSKGLVVADILEDDAEFTVEYPKWLDLKFGEKKRIDFVAKTDMIAECLAKSMYKGQTRSYCKNDKGEVHKYTRTELERLQTVPVGYTKSVSFTQACMMLGNGWTVDVIAHIFKNLKK